MSDLDKTTYLPSEMAEEIRGLKQYLGSSSTLSNTDDVLFYDYDGTVLHSFSAFNFLCLEEMPENPVHEGLISQGWNWPLKDAKQHVKKYGTLNIGQNYITDDGATRFYIDVFCNNLDVQLTIDCVEQEPPEQYVAVSINWGDDTGTEEILVNSRHLPSIFCHEHIYQKTGQYVVSVSSSAELILEPPLTYTIPYTKTKILTSKQQDQYKAIRRDMLRKVELGKKIKITNKAFSSYTMLESITIPNTLESIGDYAFANAEKLKAIIIPPSIRCFVHGAENLSRDEYVSLGINDYVPETTSSNSIQSGFRAPQYFGIFEGAISLEVVSLPNVFYDLGYSTFSKCSSLRSITLPEGLIRIGIDEFNGCQQLSEIIIPDTVKVLDNQAFSWTKISQIDMPIDIPYVSYGIFEGNNFLEGIFNFSIGSTSVPERAFNLCTKIREIILPKQITEICTQAFWQCSSLVSITIPKNVTVIVDNIFDNCLVLSQIIFESKIPPLVQKARIVTSDNYHPNPWYNVPYTCIIYVPRGSLSVYKENPDLPPSDVYEYREYDAVSLSDVSVHILNDELIITGSDAYMQNEVLDLTALNISIEDNNLVIN